MVKKDNEYTLPEKLDQNGRKELHEFLLSSVGKDLTLNFEKNEKIGGLDLQLLVVAQRRWSEDEKNLSFTNISENVEGILSLIGFKHDGTYSQVEK